MRLKPSLLATSFILGLAAPLAGMADQSLTTPNVIIYGTGNKTNGDKIYTIDVGAGAIALAGLLREKERQHGRRVGVILSGGNVDRELYQTILAR
ncbi:MAG: hypothetical protein FJ164_01615 [Gammaproteobacteria bacterium]|nr:hypothetical protein [Gammaproteobacteria bacterium]